MKVIVSLHGNAIACYEDVSQAEALVLAQHDHPPSVGDRRVANWIESHYTSNKMMEVRKFLTGDTSAKASQQDVEFCPYL